MNLSPEIVKFEKNLSFWSRPWAHHPEFKDKDLSHLPADIIDASKDYQSPTTSAWQNPRFALAYLAYFMPLNALRLKAIIKEAERLGFFSGLGNIIDVGSGSGTLPLAISDSGIELQKQFRSWTFIEADPIAIDLHQRIDRSHLQLNDQAQWLKKWAAPKSKANTLTVFSYSLNELAEWPDELFTTEALMMVEPSTQSAGRRLQEFRQKLIDRGYNIWAPCTHLDTCPLLLHSKKDWCHQRIHIKLPVELEKLHSRLPIRNSSLTYSYILARKTPPTRNGQMGRVIGDTLFEKGKIRQAICRNSDREFLSWLKKDGEPDSIPRGALLSMDFEYEQKGNELRVKTKD